MSYTTFFIAGTMQGSRRGDAQIDQAYRDQIRETVLAVFPDANVRCPGQYMQQTLAEHEMEIRLAHAALVQQESVQRADYTAPLMRLTDVFHTLVDLSADSDVCIAFLPDHEASMGTAAEMFAAFRAGKTVIAVTNMRQNLCVLACSHVIVPDMSALKTVLRQLKDNTLTF